MVFPLSGPEFRQGPIREVRQWDQGAAGPGSGGGGFGGAGSRVSTGGLLPGFEPPPQVPGPVEQGFTGEADFSAGGPGGYFPGFMQPPYPIPGYDVPGMPEGSIFSYAPSIDGTISEALLAMDPFPEELIPPFRIRPGLNGGGYGGSVRSGLPNQANVPLDDYQAVTREVAPEETVAYQLQQLLESGSPYMENALQRGRELANDRGALSSSIFAGASQRAAIEAGLPIASQDAQTYARTASENMAAQNQLILTKLQSATQQAIANAQIGGQMDVALLANDSRERIAEAQLNAQYTMMQAGFVQQQFMEQLQQGGRLQLSMLDYNQRAALANMGFTHDVNMSNLSQAQRIQIEEMFGDPRFQAQMELQRTNLMASVYTNGLNAYAGLIQSANGLDIDDAARDRLRTFAANYMQSYFSLGQAFGDIDGWPDFDFNFGAPGGG